MLDTNAFIWLTTDAPELNQKAKQLFLNPDNDFFLSLASVWEISIKHSLGKLHFQKSIENFILDQLQENTIQPLPINFRHVTRVSTLAFHHRDPFDRLLISQAIEEKMPILSSDAAFDDYPVERIW